MMIIIADAHLESSTGKDHDFFQMLSHIEKTDHDLIFMGDIFELWIGFPRYEYLPHRAFLSWCLSQKNSRRIGFVEGNHEYFVAKRRRAFFTWSTEDAYFDLESRTVFCHGDQINRLDKNYLLFRKLMKNRVTAVMVRYLPFGNSIGRKLKKSLKKTNLEFRKSLPKKEIETFAESLFTGNVESAVIGHFHQAFEYKSANGRSLHIAPMWADSGQILLFDSIRREMQTLHWRDLQ